MMGVSGLPLDMLDTEGLLHNVLTRRLHKLLLDQIAFIHLLCLTHA